MANQGTAMHAEARFMALLSHPWPGYLGATHCAMEDTLNLTNF